MHPALETIRLRIEPAGGFDQDTLPVVASHATMLADPVAMAYDAAAWLPGTVNYSGSTMRKSITLAVISALLWACASLPTYTAPFSDVDTNGDGIIEWREFKTFYPDADAKAFLEADQNKDGEITPDEWKSFVESQSP